MAYIFNDTIFKAEKQRIATRRAAINAQWQGPSNPQDTVGLALSGGGIRSATFSLGVVQSLARHDLLKKFDYLSTVSGGGYAGCFLGSLFLPEELRQGKEVSDDDCREQCNRAYAELQLAAISKPQPPEAAGVRSALTESAALETAETRKWSAIKAFDWLRNNGRYLAPRGTGDLVYVIAMQIRNWAAVQYVVGVMILTLLMSFSTLRALFIRRFDWWRSVEVMFMPDPGAAIYWSPGWLLVGIAGLIFVLPPALAYWLAHSRVDYKRVLSWLPVWHEVAIIVLLLLVLTWAYAVLLVLPRDGALPWPLDGMPRVAMTAVGYVGVSLLTIIVFLVGLNAERKTNKGKPLDLKSLRTRYTGWLRTTFWIFLGGAGLALLGTIGQTVYAYAYLKFGVGGVAGSASIVAAIVAGARQLFKWLGSRTAQEHPKIPFDALAGGAAMLLLLIIGGAWATLAQAALWKGGPPTAIPQEVCKGACGDETLRTWIHASEIDASPWKSGDESQVKPLDPAGTPLIHGRPVTISPGWMLVFFAGMAFLFLTTGMFLNFINMSSLHQFYAARLGRAYLGATNRKRFTNGLEPVTTPLQSDAIRLNAYYHERLAAPVHLINMTVNQTRPGKAQLVQRDRKGMSMVIGPRYTVVNSAIFERDDESGNLTPINGYAAALADQDPRRTKPFDAEELDLADWCAISGAAFSTGLGMRTSLGLSLLAGLANVRLGYWWNFSTHSPGSLHFAAYRYLWAELMADFKGTQQPYWFLTDGGHFENTAVYELIRRRVGTIVLCDNGCDPAFQFEDLANLSRKIRMDFGVELTEATGTVPDRIKGYFGSPADFADAEKRKHLCGLAYRITYPEDSPPGEVQQTLLIVLKPTLLSAVPIDVKQYAEANPTFPHQTTLDQFFDEAQWESYRRLGEMIGDLIFTPAQSRPFKWNEPLLSQGSR